MTGGASSPVMLMKEDTLSHRANARVPVAFLPVTDKTDYFVSLTKGVN